MDKCFELNNLIFKICLFEFWIFLISNFLKAYLKLNEIYYKYCAFFL